MQCKGQQPDHHSLIGFGGMLGDSETVLMIIMPVYVDNIDIGFANGST